MRIQVDGLLSGILVVLAAVEVDDLTREGEGIGEVGANFRESGVVAVVNRLDNSFKSGLRCQLLQLGVQLGRGGTGDVKIVLNTSVVVFHSLCNALVGGRASGAAACKQGQCHHPGKGEGKDLFHSVHGQSSM